MMRVALDSLATLFTERLCSHRKKHNNHDYRSEEETQRPYGRVFIICADIEYCTLFWHWGDLRSALHIFTISKHQIRAKRLRYVYNSAVIEMTLPSIICDTVHKRVWSAVYSAQVVMGATFIAKVG